MTRRIVSAALPFILIALLLNAPAAAQETGRQTDTWIGTVMEHGDHYDYAGSPCPVGTEFCIQAIYTYRIVPVTRQAAMALPRLAGKTARLTGELDATADAEHQGTLYVTRATR